MTVSAESQQLEQSRLRIRKIYDSKPLGEAIQRLATHLESHFSKAIAGEGHVLNWHEPEENIALADSFFQDNSLDPDHFLDRFDELISTTLSRGQTLHHPHYMGHQVPATVPMAGIFDAVTALVNNVVGIYEMGPWSTSIELALVERLGKMIGWSDGEFSGFLTHGGSLANVTALLAARNVAFNSVWGEGIRSVEQEPVIVAHAESHYSTTRAAGMLGIGTNNIVKAQLDEHRKIDPVKLNATLERLKTENRPVIAVVACACATPIGAFDPLDEIADVCEKHNVWLHVDAAHGAAVLFSERHKHLVKGIERCDSLIWDAHKMLFVPALSAFVFFKHKKHAFASFKQDTPYLFDVLDGDQADFDMGLKSMGCTKRATAYGLWGIWSLYGSKLFEDLIDITFDLAQSFYQKLLAADDFEPLHRPECNIVVFRFQPEGLKSTDPETLGSFLLKLREELIRSGEFYITPTSEDGLPAFRVTLINPLTTPDDLDELMNALRRRSKEMLVSN